VSELFYATPPELPDDTLIEDVRLSTRIRNALIFAGIKTVGQGRETPDETLYSESRQTLRRASARDAGSPVLME
jgi:hypothetical protein